MLAFHGKQEIKDFYIARVQVHRAADELIKMATEGRMGNGTFRGCAVTCTLDRYDHGAYETELGIPRILARLEDGIFEGLPQDEALAWPEQFLKSIRVGADLSMVWPKFAVWLLTDEENGVVKCAKTKKTEKAIRDVAALYQRQANGEDVATSEWREARSYDAADAAYADAYADAYAAAAAADAAADAAYAAADAAYAAAYAAYAAAAYAAYAAAAYAAYAAAAAAAYAADADAKSKARIAQSKKLLELMSEC